jgi:ribonuclease HI
LCYCGENRTYKKRLPDGCSVFTSELKAILQSLIHIRGSRKQSFVICSDSLSSLQAIEHLKFSNPIVLDILTLNHELVSQHKIIIFCWVPNHVEIRGNEQADKAAKAALELNITPCCVPYTDFRSRIHSWIYSNWQYFWDEQVNNKLYKIKPLLGPWPPFYDLSRRDQLVITRAHIGHTYLTQGYLLRKEEAPMCVSCMEVLSVEHILVHCQELSDIRETFYECRSVDDLFATVHLSKILDFLREAGLYRYF